jgi:hypothetical protein
MHRQWLTCLFCQPYFTGRDDDLTRIHEELHGAPVAALIQGHVS